MRSPRWILAVVLLFVLVGAVGASSLALASGSPVAPQFGGPPRPAPEVREPIGEPVADALRTMNWRSIGPANMGGRVAAVLGTPGDRNTWWFGGADGGVWKTTNGGVTFKPVFEDYKSYSIGALALAPSDHNVLYLGSGEGDPRNSVGYGDGVYRSTDGGETWSHLGLDDSERIHRIVVHPNDPDVALVCAMGHEWGANEERGVFKTTDGGASWDKVLYSVDENTGCADMDIDLSNPRNVYAGMWTFAASRGVLTMVARKRRCTCRATWVIPGRRSPPHRMSRWPDRGSRWRSRAPTSSTW